jgi:hypothetical protein
VHAIVRINSFNSPSLVAARRDVEAFNRLHARQPGYVGTLSVDLGEDRRLLVNLWECETHAARALEVLGREVSRVLGPLMAAPSEFLGAGTVVQTDLTLARQPSPAGSSVSHEHD